jgi:glycerophosphoryl diester phosphodiesterase
MRSSPSGADPLDPGPKGFAHRGRHFGSQVPENTLAAFSAAIDFGAGIECDLRLTADDHVVVFHDADARRLCARPLVIGQSQWEDLAGLRISGHAIPRLQSLFDFVDGRVPLLLEVKIEKDLRRWGPILERELRGYDGRFALMSFDPRMLRLLRARMPHIRRGLLIQDRRSFVERRMYVRIAEPDFLAVEFAALGKPWVASARRSRPVYSWTIRTAAERAQAEVQADALIWEGDGRPRI